MMMKQNLQSSEILALDIEREIRIIIADVLDIDESAIHLSSRFRDDLGADSLDLVTLIMAFSNAFEAEICDRDVLHIQTVGEAIAYLQQHLSLHATPVDPNRWIAFRQ
jgi:acyl carrier protein